MRRFLYFLPGRPGVNPALMAQLGLLDRFETAMGKLGQHIIRGVDDGPKGSGCIVAVGEAVPEYAPHRQTWIEGKDFWVGLEKPWPEPEDLVREMGISGHPTQLADGKVWRVPVLHRWDEAQLRHVPNLPKSMRPRPLSQGGGVEYVVRPEFADADELARALVEGFMANRTLTADLAFETAVSILNVNYRLGPEEAGLLGMLNEADVAKVLEVAIDVPSIQAQAMAMQCDGVEYTEPVIRDEE